jgi:spore coat polysaccharide biosynthesis protein SpsF (cytidylyltransferase family)
MKMNIEPVIAIQARVSSKRFPRKVLEKINGRTLIECVIERCTDTGYQVFVLTSDDLTDDPLEELLSHKKYSYYRGSLNDVRARYLNFMRKENINQVVRISADSPLIHPDVISQMISSAKDFIGYDIVTNIFPKTYPRGQSVEIVSRTAFESIRDIPLSEYDKENVTSYFYQNFSKYKIKNFSNVQNLSKVNLCVDTQLDLIKINNFTNSQQLDIFSNKLSWNKFSELITESGVFL